MANDLGTQADADPTPQPTPTAGADPYFAPAGDSAFKQLGEQPQPSLLAELFDFLKDNKKWWLLPILIIIGVFGLLMALANTAATPFIYTLW